MQRFSVLVLLCAACGNGTAEKAPSKQAELRDEIQQRVAAALPGATFEAKDDITLAVKRADGVEMEIRIENLWSKVEGAAPEEREKMIAQFVKDMVGASAPAPEPDRETKLKSIVPLVRGEAYLAEMRKASPPATRPLVADLHVVYAYDGENTLTMVPAAEVKQLKLTAEELHKLAVENLNARVGKGLQLHDFGPMFMVTCGGVFESSLLVSDKLWKNVSQGFKGDIVVGCPAQDILVFADSLNPAGVAAVRKRVEEEHKKGGKTITKTLLRRTADGWKPFEQ
jgi:uncharacterized protein YtpQ (UPF0354 family)